MSKFSGFSEGAPDANELLSETEVRSATPTPGPPEEGLKFSLVDFDNENEDVFALGNSAKAGGKRILLGVSGGLVPHPLWIDLGTD